MPTDSQGDLRQRYWSGAEIMLALREERDSTRQFIAEQLTPINTKLDKMIDVQSNHTDRLANVEQITGLQSYVKNPDGQPKPVEDVVEQSVGIILRAAFRNQKIRAGLLAAASSLGYLVSHSIYTTWIKPHDIAVPLNEAPVKPDQPYVALPPQNVTVSPTVPKINIPPTTGK